MELEKEFILVPNALVVKGTTRSIVCDLERNKYFPIPTALHVILNNSSIKTIKDALEVYAGEDVCKQESILSYFKYLIDIDVLILTNNSKYYNKIEYKYFYPGHISNGIVDIGTNKYEYLYEFMKQCEAIQCRALQVRSFICLSNEDMIELVKLFESSILEWIEIIIPFNEKTSIEEVIDNAEKNGRIRIIVLYNYHNDSIIWQSELGGVRVVGVKSNFNSIKSCGVVSEAFFSSSTIPVSEAINSNSCLNMKIAIDTEGNIRNCPSMEESYGNIKSVSIIDVVKAPSFTKYWSINKDLIYVCKDCEFRYICTDCRAYIEDPEDILSKPLKCGYNPYTGEWSEWSTNPLKQKAIQYYGMEEIVAERQERLRADAEQDKQD